MIRPPPQTLHEFVAYVSKHSSSVDSVATSRIYARWLKSGEDIETYVTAHLPTPDQVAIADLCVTNDRCTIDRARRWFLQQKLGVAETVNGLYVDIASAQLFQAFLRSSLPFHLAYNDFCVKTHIPVSPAGYNRCVALCKQSIQKTNWHPFHVGEREFWIDAPEALDEALRQWAAAENIGAPVPSNQYISVCDAAAKMSMKPEKLLSWLHVHPEHRLYQDGRYLLSREWVDQTSTTWATSSLAETIVNSIVSALPSVKRQECKADTLMWIASQPHAWLLNPDLYPQYSGGMYVSEDCIDDAQHAIRAYVHAFPAWPLYTLKDCTNLSVSVLKSNVQIGAINGISPDGTNYYVTTDEVHRIQAIADQFVSLDAIIQGIADDDCLFNLRKTQHRSDFVRFADANSWWGVRVSSGDNKPINSGLFNRLIAASDKSKLTSHITPWLLGYKQDFRSKFLILLEHYQHDYPSTVRKIRVYYARKEISKSILDMLDLFLYLLPGAWETMSKNEKADTVDSIVREFTNASLASCNEFAVFAQETGITDKCYAFDGTGLTLDTSAYPMADFAVMVAAIANEDVIAELQLAQRAADNPKFAALWLYVAMHVYSSWRSTDYKRLQAPELPCPPDVVLQMIRAGEYPEDYSRRVANYFVASQKLLWMKPNKTKNTSGVAPLYFYCPEDCISTFGTILSIAAAHYYQSGKTKPFVSVVCDTATIAAFFGPHFLAACGGKNFSGRRANKALMQAIEYESREAGMCNPLVAYTLATRVRSHKAGYGEIAKTTDIYLRDANFAGLSLDYIVYQMFQRGECSFVVDVMLNICYGEKYSTLSLAAKTDVIRSIGIPISQMDIALRCVQTAMDDAASTVQSLAVGQQELNDALFTLAAGRAHGKDMETQCVAKATGQGCKCPERSECLGCRYEIPSKVVLLKYLVAHQDCLATTESTIEAEKKRWIDANIIMPKIADIAAHMHTATSAEEMQMYIELVKEVEENGITSISAG